MKNVQEVIDELNKVEDKTLPVFYYSACGVDTITEIKVDHPNPKYWAKGVYLKN